MSLGTANLGISELLEIVKKTASKAASSLDQLRQDGCFDYEFDLTVEREVKAKADKIIEKIVLEDLVNTGIPVLSEESFGSFRHSEAGLKFILDPIDGTVNFVRGIGLASVSIALFDHDKPLFGVLAVYPSGELAWGGPGIGSFLASSAIQVSEHAERSKSILCTGIPARLDLTDQLQRERFVKEITKFAKVRMLGAASISLLNVAKGSADCYSEQDVMIWDIAAGLAILLGAGGTYSLTQGNHSYSRNVVAHNGRIELTVD